jgi:hypothetical protein
VSEGRISGHCLCGAVTVTVAGHDPRIGACHCRMCQRWSGGLFLCFSAPADRVTVTGPVVRYASSAFAERAFCATCGSHLWMRDIAEAADYELMPGLFDAARDWPLRSEVYADRASAAIRLGGDHKRVTQAGYEMEHAHVDEGDRQ